jgi:hypothetical protein
MGEQRSPRFVTFKIQVINLPAGRGRPGRVAGTDILHRGRESGIRKENKSGGHKTLHGFPLSAKLICDGMVDFAAGTPFK